MPLITSSPFKVVYNFEILSLNPIGYWRLGESGGTTAVDETGNYNGTYINTPSLGQPSLLTNNPNKSVYFNGTDEYVNISSGPSLQGQTSWTLMAWISGTSTSNGVIVSLANAAALHTDSSAKAVCLIRIGTSWYLATGTTTLLTGTTYFICGTYLDGELKIYVNGELENTTFISGTVNNFNSNYFIAKHPDTASFPTVYLNGVIDEVAAFDYDLSLAQIQTLYNLGTT